MNYERLKQPLTLAIFGITGDLAQRKLLPALYHLAQAEELPEQFRIIGISRRDVSLDDVYGQLRSFVSDDSYDIGVEQRLKEHTEMRQMDLVNHDDYVSLLQRLQEVEQELGPDGSRLYYLSIPSQAFTPIIRLLGETGHNAPLSGGGDAPRLLIEKPFGYDLESAKELIDVLGQHFGEGQVYRIDHYVAKETVQNILTFRFYNPLFESIWNNKHIDRVSVVAHEKLDIEGRANFYEQTGQYEGYRSEVNNPDSNIETFASLQLWIDNDQWTGVPILLETGKALNEKSTEISICFRQPGNADGTQNKLVFRIQPQEGITLKLQVKRPGIKTITDNAEMDFDYAKAFNLRPAEAYERVIVDAIRGDQTLFASSAEVIRSWEIIENVLQQWSRNGDGLKTYDKGSDGPVSVDKS
jgi:glucose-6-phosphate 1-dehydrogenase